MCLKHVTQLFQRHNVKFCLLDHKFLSKKGLDYVYDIFIVVVDVKFDIFVIRPIKIILLFKLKKIGLYS